MFLKLEKMNHPMKIVYFLSEKLVVDPEYMNLVQSLTLDNSKPYVGLRGSYGLFGSQKWWENIEQGKIKLRSLSGIIKKAYVAGQDPSQINNTIDLLLEDGSIETVGIYVNKYEDANLFKVGYMASVVYALDELKPEAIRNFGQRYHEVTLEMAVSLEPIT
ncbi:hypothetical protein RHO14_11735 [Orbus wheelerorum]|uniref:hypothetical protein n=1 Tax=Orbus wheelerorum TaxID=3074111 RepID=UPI00370DDBD5